MSDLTPITRTEMLLDGQDLTPITRKEMFLRRLYDETQEIPEPITREEWFLKKASEGGGGDITVESLSVTENGTYTAPSGKAYSPVTVEVQPPANSYQLKSITTPTPLATFNASAMPMPSLKASIKANQDLHGYDKPWPAGGGKNKFNPSSVLVGTYNDSTNVWSIPTTTTAAEALDATFAENTQYTFSGTATQTEADKNVRLRIVYTDDTILDLWGANTTTPTAFSVTSASGKSISKIFLTFGNSGGGVNIDHLQIEEGNQATSFEPYSNICPISGWDNAIMTDYGINIWDEVWEVGSINSTTGLNESGNCIRCKGYIPIEPDSEYYFYCGSNNEVIRSRFYDSNMNYIGLRDKAGNQVQANGVFVAPSNARYFRFAMQNTYGITYLDDISINYPSTDTDYHVGATNITISLGQTVYGGEVDVVNGGGKSTHGYVDLGTLTWNYNSEYHYFWANISDYKKGSDSLICSEYKYGGYASSSAMDSKPDYTFYRAGSSTAQVEFKNTNYTDAASFKTAMSGVQLVYELATPTTFTTQPTPIKSLNGINNLSVDCGEIIEGEYFKALGGE